MIRNILKTVTDTRLDHPPPKSTYIQDLTGFRMAPSDLTLDDLEGSKIKVILFDVKYVKNGKSYDVGPMGFNLDDLERLKVNVTML